MAAVPKLRAGFMLAPVYLIVPKCPTVTANPIANGPTKRESIRIVKITNTFSICSIKTVFFCL